MAASGRVALVGVDQQIHVVDPAGRRSRQLSYPKVSSALSRWGAVAGQGSSSWPCWSPDGRWIACFQSREEDGPLSVVSALEADGVEERELAELSGLAPIYAQWEPGGRRLAVLSQADQELELGLCDLDDLGRYRPVERGVPLFFSWAPDGGRLLIHVGSAEGLSRILLQRADGKGEPIVLPDPPGSFCTPVYSGSRPVYVGGHLGRSWLCVARPDGGRSLALGAFDGLVAVLPDPSAPRVAVGAAPRGEGTPYEGLWVAPLDGGPMARVTEDAVMAFFWAPDGGRLLYASPDLVSSCLRWRSVELASGKIRDLCPFWPSRELLFYLHFFEQFATSHPLVSPDSRSLVFASYAASEQGTPDTARCHVLAIDLDDPDPQPRILGEGTLGVFSPA